MKNSKKHNKLGVKFLASVLSVITFSLVTTPYAKAKEVGSGNSVVRRIKKVGLRANESAKGVWTKIWTWMKNNPKKTIAIGVVVALAVSGAVGFACYKSNKGKKEKERLEAARKAEEEAARKEAEEAKKAAEEEKEEEKKEEEKKEEEPEKKSVDEEASEGQEGDSKLEPVVAGETNAQMSSDNGHLGDSQEERKKILEEASQKFGDLDTKVESLISECITRPDLQNNVGTLEDFRNCIKKLVEDLKSNGFKKNVMEYFDRRYADFFVALGKGSFRGDNDLSIEFQEHCKFLSEHYSNWCAIKKE